MSQKLFHIHIKTLPIAQLDTWIQPCVTLGHRVTLPLCFLNGQQGGCRSQPYIPNVLRSKVTSAPWPNSGDSMTDDLLSHPVAPKPFLILCHLGFPDFFTKRKVGMRKICWEDHSVPPYLILQGLRLCPYWVMARLCRLQLWWGDCNHLLGGLSCPMRLCLTSRCPPPPALTARGS